LEKDSEKDKTEYSRWEKI